MRHWQNSVLAVPPVAALALVLLSCGGGGGGRATDDPFGLTQRVAVSGLTFPTGVPSPSPLQRIDAFPNLRFSRPVFVTHAPDGTDRLFVVEQDGRILVFPNDPTTTSDQVTTFLDIRSRVSRLDNEEGLLGLAFDPDYTSNGRFFVYYSAASPRRSVLSRFFVTADPNISLPTTEAVLLTVPQPFGNHNGGMIAFGPDDMLYVGLGDGGAGGDPEENGQNRSTLLGSLLRIDVSAGSSYAVPSDNPFVSTIGARGEIWAYGLRNPWRFSFDRNTGDLWLGDVGQGGREEIDLVERGANLGWDVYEGNVSYENPTGLPETAFAQPIVSYGRGLGTTVIGGCVYRGTELPGLRGAYVYGDYGSGRVWALVWDGASLVSNQEVATVTELVSFGEDRDGEIYAVSLSGEISRFQETGGGGAPPDFPEHLSETGLFANLATLAPVPGLIEYEVNAELWSDGARKRRWIALPGFSRIEFDETEAWSFPQGTVLVKHFEIDEAPGVVRRIETRVLIHEAGGWAGYTYRWNDAQTDADLLPGGLVETIDVYDPSELDGTREQTWSYPSRTDCLRCHTAAAGRVLGVRTMQMNRSFDYSAVTDNQLRAWNHIGLFTTDIGAPSSYGVLPDPSDPGETATRRARAYLDANCAMCHQPGGPTPVNVDLRFLTPAASMNVVDVRPTAGDLGLPDAWRVRSGDADASVLWERMRRLDATRMPPLASHRVDGAAVSFVGAWIDAGAE